MRLLSFCPIFSHFANNMKTFLVSPCMRQYDIWQLPSIHNPIWSSVVSSNCGQTWNYIRDMKYINWLNTWQIDKTAVNYPPHEPHYFMCQNINIVDLILCKRNDYVSPFVIIWLISIMRPIQVRGTWVLCSYYLLQHMICFVKAKLHIWTFWDLLCRDHTKHHIDEHLIGCWRCWFLLPLFQVVYLN